MNRKLTPKQRQFIQQYILCNGNATEAYRRAGYESKNPDVDAAKLLVNPRISEQIQREQIQAQETFKIKKEDLVNELAAIAFGSVGELVDWDADGCRIKSKSELTAQQIKFIEKIQFKTDANGTQTVYVNTLAKEKIKAVEVLSKLLGFDQPQDANNAYKKALDEALIELEKEAKKSANEFLEK